MSFLDKQQIVFVIEVVILQHSLDIACIAQTMRLQAQVGKICTNSNDSIGRHAVGSETQENLFTSAKQLTRSDSKSKSVSLEVIFVFNEE